jgi:hypothetical protein
MPQAIDWYVLNAKISGFFCLWHGGMPEPLASKAIKVIDRIVVIPRRCS